MNLNTVKKISALLLAAVMLCLVLSGCSTTETTATDGTTTASGGYTIVMLLVIVVVFYFFMIRPENKRKKQVTEMRNALTVGDKITTIGGLTGKIVHVDGDLITFETGEDRVRIQIARWGISTNNDKGTEQK